MSGSRNASNKRSAILRRDGAYCALCGRFVLGKSRSVDHIMPHREGGTKELDNLRMVHRACNQARDEHYRLNEADTLEHLEALCDLARCVDALYPGVRWRFSRLPDKASPVYEIEVFSVPAEVQLHARRLGRVKSRLEQRYGSYVAFKVTPHADATPFESEDSITVAFSKNDRLTRALQMTALSRPERAGNLPSGLQAGVPAYLPARPRRAR